MEKESLTYKEFMDKMKWSNEITARMQGIRETLDLLRKTGPAAVHAQSVASLEEALAIIESSGSIIEALRIKVKGMYERARLTAGKMFASSSEKHPADDLGASSLSEASTEPAGARKNRGNKLIDRKEQRAAKLESIEINLDPAECACEFCQGGLTKIEEMVHERYEYFPEAIKVMRYFRGRYACKKCARERGLKPFAMVALPMPLIPNSMATASFVSHLAYNKFVLSLPIYRQAKHFSYSCADFSRQSFIGWIQRCAKDYISIIYLLIKGKLLREQILHADETTITVLKEEGRKPQNLSYFWVLRTGPHSPVQAVLFKYSPTRAGENAAELLLGSCCRYLHTDGYPGYNVLAAEIRLVGCWAHLRRYWHDAYQALSAEQRKSSSSRNVLAKLNEIFAWERKFSKEGLTPEELREKRANVIKPLADKLFEYIEQLNPHPSMALLVGAQGYSLNQKSKLYTVFEDGRLDFTNNCAERAIRTVALGRGNWLFCDTVQGASTCEVMYTFFDTAIENNLYPEKYMTCVLERMPAALGNNALIEELLPWSPSLPAHLRMKPGGKKELQDAIYEAAELAGTDSDAECM